MTGMPRMSVDCTRAGPVDEMDAADALRLRERGRPAACPPASSPKASRIAFSIGAGVEAADDVEVRARRAEVGGVEAADLRQRVALDHLGVGNRRP